jgi:hypothetical protein
MRGNRYPCTIGVRPWFHDHSVGGTIVLPAVETMLLLAANCATILPEIDVRVMEDVSFGKFLEIPPDAATVAAMIECSAGADGRVQARLLSHVQLGAMARIKEHGALFFPPAGRLAPQPLQDIDPAPPTGPATEIDTHRLYREMVPFGPHYRTLQETLYLTHNEAWGRLRAADLPFIDPVQKIIGSPFPLDGAMHAACVLGQQYEDFPPFPVRFARRIISRPTQPGATYLTRVTMTSRTRDELLFDLAIFSEEGLLYESVTGLRMRDVRKALKK